MSNDNYQFYTARVRQGGRVTIPRKLRIALRIEVGDTVTVLPIGETLVLTPRQLKIPALINSMADILEESEVSLADLLLDLPQIRESLFKEKYSSNP